MAFKICIFKKSLCTEKAAYGRGGGGMFMACGRDILTLQSSKLGFVSYAYWVTP